MRTPRRPLAYGALLAVLSILLAGPDPAAAGAAAETSAPPSTPASTAVEPARQITLLTGDRVTIHDGHITVPPRDGVHFLRSTRDTGDYLIPTDALPLLNADQLDERLFNIAALLDADYDKLPYLPVIVSDADRVHGLPTGDGLEAVDGFASEIPTRDLATTWADLRDRLPDGSKVWLDGVRHTDLGQSVPMTGAPQLWDMGLDGTGVRVAVLDTGIDDTHPDLAGRVAERVNFVADIEPELDVNGHGTHVAATVAGSGEASGGFHRGMAPGAQLLDGKVCYNVQGIGLCRDSAILEAMQWAVDSGADIVNLSLGHTDLPGPGPMEETINELTAENGTLFVASAGNRSSGDERVASPSTADAALSVANIDKSGAVNPGSLPGPRIGDYAIKPEIGAPGTDIVSARSPSGGQHLQPGPYLSLTGTSMASPHVAGAAALLAQANPAWSAAQLKAALMGAAAPNPSYDVFAQGAGQLDVPAALQQPVTVSPPSLNAGLLSWPHTGEPHQKTLTYHNRGQEPVALDLAFTGDVPEELLSLNATRLTVPARGEASVTVTIDPRADDEYRLYGGWLVATGAGVRVGAPFAVYYEPPAATLAVTVTGRDGGEPASVRGEARNPETGESYSFTGPHEALRVPLDSTWVITATLTEEDGTTVLLRHNQVVADRDQAVALDARQARPLDLTVPDRRASAQQATVDIIRGAPFFWRTTIIGDPETIFTASFGPDGVPNITTQVHAVFEADAKPGPGEQAPDVYQVSWEIPGSFITGLVRHVRRADLAKVTVEYAANAAGVVAVRRNAILNTVGAFPLEVALPPVPVPARRVEYYSTDVSWQPRVLETDPATGAIVSQLAAGEPRTYRVGHHRERWNGAVLSPAAPGRFEPLLRREGDTLFASLDALTDGAGHAAVWRQGAEHSLQLRHEDGVVGEFDSAWGSWSVAAEATTYELRHVYQLPDRFRLSTRVETEWTFTTSAGATGPIPITSVNLHPRLGLDNSARPHGMLRIPLTFGQEPGAATVVTAELAVSFDDGATWTSMRVRPRGDQFVAMVAHSRQAGFVSLRVSAVDADGNRVVTTVHRAYELA